MTNEDKIAIIKEVAAVVDGSVYEGYSGRGMYGLECYGITCDDPQQAMEEAAQRGLKGSREDNMGKQYIVYWPGVACGKQPA